MVGCSAPARESATTQATTVPTSRPVVENIVVDLAVDQGELKPHTAAVFRPGTAPNPPGELLKALRPLLAERPPLLVTLGDVVSFDGRFPGDKGNWDKWDTGVAELVRKHKADGTPVYWEVWNEPDAKETFKGTQAAYFSIWVHTARLIRSIDEQAVLVGPGPSKYTWVQEFLKVGKEYDVLPDIVWWHEESFRSDVAGHITSASEGFWQDGTARDHIIVSQKQSDAHKYRPGDPVILLAHLQQAHRDNAFRQVKEEFAFKLSHLVTKDRKPRALYWSYATYAGMVGQKQVKVSGGVTVDGLATVDSARAVTVLLGRNRGRSPTTMPSSQQLGEAFVVVKNLAGQAVRVEGRVIPADAGERAMEQPAPVVLDSVVPVAKREAKFRLPALANGEAIVLTVTPAGGATTTATAPPR
jgi:hypothetical protein